MTHGPAFSAFCFGKWFCDSIPLIILFSTLKSNRKHGEKWEGLEYVWKERKRWIVLRKGGRGKEIYENVGKVREKN